MFPQTSHQQSGQSDDRVPAVMTSDRADCSEACASRSRWGGAAAVVVVDVVAVVVVWTMTSLAVVIGG